MFTGIIQTRGKVALVQPNAFGVRLEIDPRPRNWAYQPTHGDSIAVNGVCLTHAPAKPDDGLPGPSSGSSAADWLCFDVIRETLSRTNLGKLKVGDEVNLESSMRADTPIAGHFVQGHVDAVGSVSAIHAGKDEWRVTLAVDPAVMPFIVPKGSIAIDGVSLTIAAIDSATATFTVALIPTTLDITTFGNMKVGDPVNLETDMIVRSIVHVLALQGTIKTPSTLTMQKLRDAGFAE